MNEPCICGHKIEKHKKSGLYYFCQNRPLIIERLCLCDNFKLDNLKLIEQLADAKGLV